MAQEVITRFKLETTAFDSKIKQAAKDLSAYSKTATQAKEGFDKFTKANVDAARALGSMTTSATNAKDRAKELVGAFNEAAKAYNSLTKEQQQSDWAKALAGSLTQLQQRIKETKQEMQGLSNTMKGDAKGGIFDALGSKMSGALAVFGGNMMTAAAGAVAQLGSEMADMVKQGVEMAKAGEGVRIAFERLGRGDILDGLREATHGTVTDLELMKAAVKFNDFKLPVEELGTMLAFAQQKAKDTGQSVDYMVDSIVTGLGRKSLMILDNLGLSAAEIKDKMKDTGDMTKAVGAIIREQMAKAGDYVETAADRAAQANVEIQNKMEELGRKFGPVEEASNQLWTSMKIGILDIIGGPLAQLLNSLTEAGRLKNALNDLNGGGNGKESQTEKALRILREYSGGRRGIEGKRDLYNRQVASYNSQEEKAWRKANRLRAQLDRINNRKGKDPAGYDQADVDNLTRQMEAAENRAKAIQIMRANYQKGAADILNPKPAPTTPVVPPFKPTKPTKEDIQFADDSIMAQEKLVSDLTQKWKTASGELRDGYLKDLTAAQNKLNEMTGKGAKTATPQMVTGLSGFNEQTISAWTSMIKSDLAKADIGSDLYNSLTKNLSDMSKLTTSVQDAIKLGLDIPQDAVQQMFEQIFDQENMPEDVYAGMIQKFIDYFKEKTGQDLKVGENGSLGVENGKDDKDERGNNKLLKLNEDTHKYEAKANELLSSMSGGIQNITSGLESLGVEIPSELKSVLGGMQSISTILTGIAATVIAIEAIAGADAIIPFAGGGIVGRAAGGLMVPGNSMSGDRLRLPVDGGLGMIGVNSGELILNRAQQGNLASQLEGGGMGNMRLSATIDGEDIILAINNRGERTGYGEFVQSKNR